MGYFEIGRLPAGKLRVTVAGRSIADIGTMTVRGLDQIAISICYAGLNVKIPGSYPGLPTSRAGASHNCLEDLAVMRTLPGLRIADPGDNADLLAIMQAAVATPGPVYFRVTRLTLPPLPRTAPGFQWGKGVILRPGKDVTLFGTGMMTSLCLRAADLLAAGDGGNDLPMLSLAEAFFVPTSAPQEVREKAACLVDVPRTGLFGPMLEYAFAHFKLS